MLNLDQKIVVISGAAGNLGRAAVQAFLGAGARVCALDYKEGRMSDLEAEDNAANQLFLFEGVDVRNRGEMFQVAETIHQKLGPVDVLVNTIGGFTFGDPVHELTPEVWERMMSLNVHSFLNLTGAFIPHLTEKGAGKVVAVGARASLKGNGRTGAYSAAKSALLRLTESMSMELASANIQVNSVLPGTIDTPDNRAAMPQADPSTWVSPEQVANVILFLASSLSNGVSGAAVPVYG